jgi:hypothetical protein
MLKKCLAALVMVGLIGSVALAADEFDWRKEQVGKLHHGLSEKEVKQIITGKPVLGPEELSLSDAAYHQEWKYAEAGISLNMVSEKKGGLKTIDAMTITSPSKLQTQRGIGIGSTEAAVAKAYGPFRNAFESENIGGFIAGSVFGGVTFHFQHGKVSSIFIGAAD